MKAVSVPLRLTVGLGAVILVAQAIFYLVAFSAGGFADYHRYGKYDDFTAWLSRLGITEIQFYAWYFCVGSLIIISLLALFRVTGLGTWLVSKGRSVSAIRESWLVVMLFMGAVILGFMCTLFSHKGTPLTDDEWVYRFQAQLLAQGRLTAQLYGPADFFRNQYLVVTDKAYSQYAFGHPALLVPGVWLGSLLVPLLALGGLTTILIYKLVSYKTTRSGGLLAALLLLFSPAFLLTQGTTAAQSSIITLLSAFLYAMLRAITERRLGFGLVAGLLCGVAVQIRPIDTIIVAGAASVWFAGCRSEWRDRRIWRTAGAIVVGGLITGGLYLLTNWRVNGGPFTTNYNPLWKDHASGAKSAFGFGKYPWGIEHTPEKGAVHAAVNFVRLNFWALGWPLSWLPILAGLVIGRDRWLRISLGLMIVTPFILYVFYFWPGMCDTGPAYYHFLLPCMVFAAVLGLENLKASNCRLFQRLFAAPGLLVVAACYVSAALFIPIQAVSLRSVTALIKEPYIYLEAHLTGKALVFTPFYFYLTVNTQHGLSVELTTPVIGLRNNQPNLSDRIVLVRDLKDRNHELISRFPERVPYRFVRRGVGMYELTRLGQDGVEASKNQPKQPKLIQLH